MKTLSLDISSSTIGWSLLILNKENNLELKKYGYIKPTKKGTLAERAIDAVEKYKKILDDTKPDEVIVEDYANKFSKGKSTARTIIVLAVFNETIKIATIEHVKIIPVSYPVTTIRSVVKKHYGFEIKDKEQVMDFCKSNFENYKSVLNRNDNIKKECYDECDAIVVGVCHYIKNLNSKNGDK